MTVEIVSGLKGKERGHAHRHRPQRLVADVEVVMREAAALPSQDAVVGIVGGKAGNRGAEGLALLHAFQNEVHPMLPGPFHAAQGGTNIILLAYLRLGPFEGGVVARKRLHPCLILVGSPRQHFLGDHRLANHVLKEIRHLTRPRQTAQITVDHHTVKTVVYKKKQAAKQLGERLHRSSSSGLVMTTRSSDGRPVEANFKYVCLALTLLLKHGFWFRPCPAVPPGNKQRRQKCGHNHTGSNQRRGWSSCRCVLMVCGCHNRRDRCGLSSSRCSGNSSNSRSTCQPISYD